MFPSLAKNNIDYVPVLLFNVFATEPKKKSHKQARGRRKGVGRTRRHSYSLLCITQCLWNVAHENCMNIRTKSKGLTVKSMRRSHGEKYWVSQETITKVNEKF